MGERGKDLSKISVDALEAMRLERLAKIAAIEAELRSIERELCGRREAMKRKTA